jgi:hypothetical protein
MGLKGYRLWVMGQLDSTCRAPPRHVSPTTAPARLRMTLMRCSVRLIPARLSAPTETRGLRCGLGFRV